nr:hypothetical protein [Tanacetum cinerariifolium]
AARCPPGPHLACRAHRAGRRQGTRVPGQPVAFLQELAARRKAAFEREANRRLRQQLDAYMRQEPLLSDEDRAGLRAQKFVLDPAQLGLAKGVVSFPYHVSYNAMSNFRGKDYAGRFGPVFTFAELQAYLSPTSSLRRLVSLSSTGGFFERSTALHYQVFSGWALLLPALASSQARKPLAPVQRQSSPAASMQLALQQAFATHLRTFQQEATEDQEARKVVYGDVDGDGVRDAVVQYTLDNNRGNNWSQRLAVFLHKRGTYKLVADGVVGGKYFRYFEAAKIVDRSIIGQTQTCPDGSPQLSAHSSKRLNQLKANRACLRELILMGDSRIYDSTTFSLPVEIGQLRTLKRLTFLNLPIDFPAWIVDLPRLRTLTNIASKTPLEKVTVSGPASRRARRGTLAGYGAPVGRLRNNSPRAISAS